MDYRVDVIIDIIDYVNGIGNSARRLIYTVLYGRALRVWLLEALR